MTDNDPTTYGDDGADLTADGGDVLSAAEVLAESVTTWLIRNGWVDEREDSPSAEALRDNLEVHLAARAAADEEAAAVRAENARLREQVDLERFKYEHAHKGALIYADRAHVAEAQVAAVRALADEWDATASGYVDPSDGPIWYAHALQRCARRIRAALDAPTATQPEPVVLDLADPYFDGQTLPDALSKYEHVHSTTGTCVKAPNGRFCTATQPEQGGAS